MAARSTDRLGPQQNRSRQRRRAVRSCTTVGHTPLTDRQPSAARRPRQGVAAASESAVAASVAQRVDLAELLCTLSMLTDRIGPWHRTARAGTAATGQALGPAADHPVRRHPTGDPQAQDLLVQLRDLLLEMSPNPSPSRSNSAAALPCCSPSSPAPLLGTSADAVGPGEPGDPNRPPRMGLHAGPALVLSG